MRQIVITSFKQRNIPILEPKRAMADKIAEDTAAFLAKGKSVEEVGMGVSGYANAIKPYQQMPYIDYIRTVRIGGRTKPHKTLSKKTRELNADYLSNIEE